MCNEISIRVGHTNEGIFDKIKLIEDEICENHKSAMQMLKDADALRKEIFAKYIMRKCVNKK